MGHIVSRLDEDTVILVETESSGATFAKNEDEVQADPERAIFQAVETVQKLSRVIAAGILPTVRDVRASGFEVQYRVKIDAHGAVALSASADDGQLKVTLRWSAHAG